MGEYPHPMSGTFGAALPFARFNPNHLERVLHPNTQIEGINPYPPIDCEYMYTYMSASQQWLIAREYAPRPPRGGKEVDVPPE